MKTAGLRGQLNVGNPFEDSGVAAGYEEKPGRFRGGLVFKAHRLLLHSTLGLRETKKKKETWSDTD